MTQHLLSLLFQLIHLSRELKGAFRVRELTQKRELRTLEVNSIVPACNGKEQVLAVEERARQCTSKQIFIK